MEQTVTPKKIMIAVDDSVHAKQAVKYAVQMSSTVNGLHYVLFHAQPMISIYLQDEAQKSPAAKVELDRARKKSERNAHQLLSNCKDRMIEVGIEGDRIETMTAPKKGGIAKDILGVARDKLYDAVAVGRRGVSGLQKILMGSVTADLVEHAQTVPIWIIDGKVETHHILVAVDGSEHSLRALDHVSFMVGDNKDVHLTLFHVKGGGANFESIEFDEARSEELGKIVACGNEKLVDEFHRRGVQILKDAGIGQERYEIQMTKRTRNAGKAILEKAVEKNFGTIVMGRRGTNKSFFMGSVSRYVLNNATNRALWLVS